VDRLKKLSDQIPCSWAALPSLFLVLFCLAKAMWLPNRLFLSLIEKQQVERSPADGRFQATEKRIHFCALKFHSKQRWSALDQSQ